MKISLVVLCSMVTAVLWSQSYPEELKQASAAYKARKFELALEHYAKAHRLAPDANARFRLLPVQITLYMKLKKIAELEAFLAKERRDESYSDMQLRYLLNRHAMLHVWPKRDSRFAMTLLQMARMLPAEKGSNFYFETYQLIADIYYGQKRYDYAIYYMEPLLKEPKLHPSNRYKTCMVIGRSYLAQGNKAKALKYFREAQEAGKKVPYKYNYSEAERYIKGLTK
ncbi:MAG: hypothetical protein IKO93_01465 [Lentisphaeria bacterium]|nr:hypothetical protein [Lentisphaeria bacterium]